MLTHTEPTKPGEPRHVYQDMDEAVHAACCLSSLDPAGATIWYRYRKADNGEDYMITTKAVRVDGVPWDLGDDDNDWEPVYAITRCPKVK